MKPVISSWTLALLVVILAAPGSAQNTPQPGISNLTEGTITLDIVTDRFISTYRDGRWVPVDVIVNNNKRDVSGHIEITTFDTSKRRQSPVYRVRAESPKGSRKRFRLYCRLDKADKLEVTLLHKNRNVMDAPMEIRLRPIKSEALLCMILDDAPEEYGFLFTVMHSQGENVGFYHDDFNSSQLGALPEYPQCYEPFDLIIMGKVDPTTMPMRNRELIRRYVEEGGIFVVCTGENALRYRDTWVEKLAGVEIGPLLTMDQSDLAARVFPPELRDGARAGRDSVVTQLTPVAPETRVFSRDPVLATIRSIGSGHIVVVALDAPSKTLHGCTGYIQMWYDVCTMRYKKDSLNFSAASQYVAQAMPQATGIRIYPRSDVFRYLLAYFVIAIVLNWIVWSLLKRREMAWVCLVLFSFAFTAYAMVYGTAGRAKATELEQLEVVRVSQGGRVARLHSYVGLLTARTSRFSFDLAHPYSLVYEGAPAEDPWRGRQRRSMFGAGQSPFTFLEGSAAAIHNFGVGASVMRVIQVESDLSLPGGIEGALEYDKTGLHGTLTNNTGLRLRDPRVFLDGREFNVSAKKDALRVNIPARRFDAPSRQTNPMDMLNAYRGYRSNAASVDSLKEPFKSALFLKNDVRGALDDSLGPYLCGWVDGPRFGSVVLDEDAEERISETFVVADIQIIHGEASPVSWQGLAVHIDGALWDNPGSANLFSQSNYYYNAWSQSAYNMQMNKEASVDILIPWRVQRLQPGKLVIDLLWGGGNQGGRIVFVPEGHDVSWADDHLEGTTAVTIRNQKVNKSTYHVTDWKDLLDVETGRLKGTVQISAPKPTLNDANARKIVVLMAKKKKSGLTEKEEAELARRAKTHQQRVQQLEVNRRVSIQRGGYASFMIQPKIEVRHVDLEEDDWKIWR